MLRRLRVSGLIVVLLLAAVNPVYSRELQAAPAAVYFEDIGANLTAVHDSAVAWGDYDADGDLDLIVTGHTGTAFLSTIYRNNGDHTFTNINANIVGVRNGAVAWGDANNDGLLDALVAGYSASGPVTKLYRNDGSDKFTEVTTAVLPGISRGSIGWGDYDNNGRLDVLIAGESATGSITKIYRNNSGITFTDSGYSLPGISNGVAVWGDYNSDGWVDVVLTGEGKTGTPTTKVYRNTGTSFIEVATSLLALSDSTAAWGDYDNDGDLDILSAGYNGTTGVAKVYRNDNGSFTDINAGLLTGDSFTARAAWGDYDGDGRLDIVLSSQSGTNVYHNDGNNIFTDVQVGLPVITSGALAWGDYNGDRKLDLVLTGRSSQGSQNKVFRNIVTTTNAAPTAPGSLVANTAARMVTLSWGAGSDVQTPAAGLTYNLRIGTTATGGQLVPPMSMSNGTRLIPAFGNRYHTRSAVLTNLSPGLYYWSVQAVDPGFVGSTFSVTGTFRIWAYNVNLPLIVNNFVQLFDSPTEIEPNNTPAQANGPLISGRAYNGLHNDDKDYFSFYASAPGQATMVLTTTYVDHLQLQLRSPATNGTNLLAYVYAQPFSLTYPITQAGWYYAYIFVESNYVDNSAYTLTVSFP
ncbi:MAG: VCBS repeat-containing protein [Anaerolineae bacterium]